MDKFIPSKEIIVSVCMITYNHEPYIAQAIDSVLNQLCDFKVELILANDCSRDKTDSIIKNYLQNHPKKDWVKYTFHQQNKGLVGNFIWALGQCSGKYVAFCEGDDYWTDPNKLQKQVDFLESNPSYNICFTYSRKVTADGIIMEVSEKLSIIEYTQYDFLIGRKYETRTPTILARNTGFQKNFNIKIHNADTWLKIIATRNSRGIVLPYITACYRVHNGGVWSNAKPLFKHNIAVRDWIEKLKYAIKYHLSAILPIVLFLSIAFSKFAILRMHCFCKKLVGSND